MDAGKKKTTGDEEVEQLLRATQDEVLLKLSVDSHMSHVSPYYIGSDLDRRFQALRSRPSKSKSKFQAVSSKSKPPPPQQQEQQSQSDDDLLARFAALKASLPSSSTVGVLAGSDVIDDDNDDEVDKVIRWAIDAARLDPSLPSDDDDDCESDDDDDDDKHSTDDEDLEGTDDDGKLKKNKKTQAQRK